MVLEYFFLYEPQRKKSKGGIDNASRKIGLDVMMQLCQRVLAGKGMPKDCITSVIMPIYKKKKM